MGLIPATMLGGSWEGRCPRDSGNVGGVSVIDRALQHRQKAQRERPIRAVGLADLLSPAPASRLLPRALDRHDLMTLRGQLSLQYLNIGEIKGKLDHRAHRAVRPRRGLLCSDSIAPVSVTTTSGGYHGKYGRANLSGALDKILRLRGVSFRWRDEPSKPERQFGLIGQEVSEVLPEAVFQDEYGFFRIAYCSN
jgi:hypothetical protein